MTGLTVRLQGLPTLSIGGDDKVVPASVQPLLVVLVTAGVKGLARSAAVTHLWPDEPASKTRRRFNTALWRLRELFAVGAGDTEDAIADRAPRDVVSSDAILGATPSGWLSLNWDVVHVDARPLFDLARAHPTEVGSWPAERLERSAAIDVNSLFGDCDHEYVVAVREQLRAAHTESCTRLAHTSLDGSQYMVAVHWARQGLVSDPYREDLHQIIIRGLDLAGRPADANRQFDVCRRLLVEDLGVEPLPSTADALNARGQNSSVQRHVDLTALQRSLEEAVQLCERAANAGHHALQSLKAAGDRPVTARDRAEIDLR